MRKNNPLPPQSDLRSELEYHEETGALIWKHSKKGVKARSSAGSTRHDGYLIIRFQGVQYLGHRIIWKWMTGEDPPYHLDHRDGRPSNNAWDNLRTATEAQNHRNVNHRKNNTSGVKGVCWDKLKNKWLATIRAGGPKIFVGRFDDLRQAEEAIRLKRQELHNEFANNG